MKNKHPGRVVMARYTADGYSLLIPCTAVEAEILLPGPSPVGMDAPTPLLQLGFVLQLIGGGRLVLIFYAFFRACVLSVTQPVP